MLCSFSTIEIPVGSDVGSVGRPWAPAVFGLPRCRLSPGQLLPVTAGLVAPFPQDAFTATVTAAFAPLPATRIALAEKGRTIFFLVGWPLTASLLLNVLAGGLDCNALKLR